MLQEPLPESLQNEPAGKFACHVGRAVQMRKLFPYFVALFCFCLSLYVYFPGWMSPDSFDQFSQAKSGLYNDWHPVFMAWWWSILLHIWDGPQPVLLQNLLFYWSAWLLLALWAERRIGWGAALVPVFGLWPGLSFPLGQIWKDIWFAVPLMFAWALLQYASDQGRRLTWWHRTLVFFSLAMSIGVKPNGIVVLPFVVSYWLWLERPQQQISRRKFTLYIAGTTILVSMIPMLIVATLPVRHTPNFQYTETYDLLAISVAEDRNFMPAYVTTKLGEEKKLNTLYFSGGNNLLFYNTAGNLTTTDKIELADLTSRWVSSIIEYPEVYLAHRLRNFLTLMRIGETTAAWVAVPHNDRNDFGIEDRSTPIGQWLGSTADFAPWLYFPWLYAIVLAVSTAALRWSTGRWGMPALMSLSAVAFAAPHFFIAPASDYRYLYYSYTCAMLLLVMAIVEAVGKWSSQRSKQNIQGQGR